MSSKRDFRKLDAATQAELRRVAVGMVVAGKTRCEVAEAVGVNRRFVGQWVTAVAQSGETALLVANAAAVPASRRRCRHLPRLGSDG